MRFRLLLPVVAYLLLGFTAEVRAQIPTELRWGGDAEGGAPFVEAAGGSVLIGGDWTTGARVESAWDSGEAMANRLLHGASVAQA